jgi:hypothetical protein
MERRVAMDDLAPRCYVLDETYKLVLASAPSPHDPLYPLYDAESAPNRLPSEIERSVRTLAGHWERTSQPQEGSALVRGLRVTVVPLHGAGGRHIAVFIAASPGGDPGWDYAASA